MTKLNPTRRARPSEEGYMLLAVIFMLAILILSLSIAAPRIAKEIQRDREIETKQRGRQYIRAIKMYNKKFNGAYPPNVDALVKGVNGIRFLRKKYVDPTTGKEEWKPIRMGQNKAPTAMGFFGQPMAGSSLGAIGTGSIPGATTLGSGIGSPSSGSSMFGSGSTPGSNSPLGATTDPTTGTSGTDTSGTSASAPGLSGTTGQTFGGAGIIGFSPNSPKASLLVYKKKTHYNEWEFVYDPVTDRMMVSGGGAGAGGQSAGSMTNPVGGSPGGGSPGIGGGLNPGGNNPTPPQPPQQQ